VRPTKQLAAGALIALVVGSHLWYLPKSLEDIDSINLALGVRDFDVAHHQPHPPGYPVFIVVARALSYFVPGELQALAVASALAAGLALAGLPRLFALLSGDPESDAIARTATVLVAVCPLFWLTGVRPLSDMTGLAAAIAVQGLILSSRSVRSIGLSAVLAGFAAGVRSQVVWLTLPLLVRTLTLQAAAERGRATIVAVVGATAGALVWLVPVAVDTGGVRAYWRLLVEQGGEDLGGVVMLATSFTPRHGLEALRNIFVAPWAYDLLAGAILTAAVVGMLRMHRRAPVGLVVVATAFGPYFLFCLLFQETSTTRYALPLVVPVAYLATSGLFVVPRRVAAAAAAAIILLCFALDARTLYAYSSKEAPAFRMLGEMARAARSSPMTPVLAMHRRNDLEMKRPLQWMGDRMPSLDRRLAAPPKHEWLQLVQYWNSGGRAPVWFVADPTRSDLALVHAQRRPAEYRWPFVTRYLLGGIRPNEMDWYTINPPDWYLGEGWALTPETAGVAMEDRRGPGYGAIQGWIRRWPGRVNLMIGGRNLAPAGTVAHIRVSLDGTLVGDVAVQPGFFLRTWSVVFSPGSTDFAALTIASDNKALSVEQFDSQPDDRLIYGFGAGWHELEINPATGALWRWSSDRAVIEVRPGGHAATLSIRGELEAASRSHVTVRAGGSEVAAFDVDREFARATLIPAALLTGPEPTITIESSAWYVPADRRSRSSDHRRLALKLRECLLTPAS
jgi:hypothetical protein